MESIFFVNDTATTEIYTLSLHDALPIFKLRRLPALDFVADTSFDEAGRIESLLKTPAVARDLGAEEFPGEKPESEEGSPGDGA